VFGIAAILTTTARAETSALHWSRSDRMVGRAAANGAWRRPGLPRDRGETRGKLSPAQRLATVICWPPYCPVSNEVASRLKERPPRRKELW